MTMHHGYAIEMTRQRHEQIRTDFQVSRRSRPAERHRWRDRVTWHRSERAEVPAASVQTAPAS